MRHIVQISGGLASAEAAVRVAQRHSIDDLTMVFCDTLTEDNDLYRFLIEGCAFIVGKLTDEVRALAAEAMDIPAVEDDRPVDRKAMIMRLRERTTALIPQLVWLVDGRNVWEVFESERFLGHSRFDPCSRALKRTLSDLWRVGNCDKASTILYLGFTFSEQNRIERLSARMARDDWRVEFPMDDAPLLSRLPLMQEWIDRGIQPPRLYYMGFKHNNCGGFCCKAGHGAMAHLLDVLPRRYAFHERKEQELRDVLGDVSMLTDRRGDGKKKPLTLKVLRERIENGEQCDIDWGACSCFAEPEEDAA